MGIHLIIGLGMFLLVLFLLSLIGMFSFRSSTSRNEQKSEILQLRQRVENLENRMEHKE